MLFFNPLWLSHCKLTIARFKASHALQPILACYATKPQSVSFDADLHCWGKKIMILYVKERTSPGSNSHLLSYMLIGDDGALSFGLDEVTVDSKENQWNWEVLSKGVDTIRNKFKGREFEIVSDHETFASAIGGRNPTKDEENILCLLANRKNGDSLPNVGKTGERIFENFFTGDYSGPPEFKGYRIDTVTRKRDSIAGFDFELVKEASPNLRVELKSYYAPTSSIFLKKRQIVEGLGGKIQAGKNKSQGNPHFYLVLMQVDVKDTSIPKRVDVFKNPFRNRKDMPHLFRDLLTLPITSLMLRADKTIAQLNSHKPYNDLLDENNPQQGGGGNA